MSPYTDFDIDFTKNEFTSDINLKSGIHSIRQSILNIIMTRPGEKPFDSNFGVGITDYLFENIDDLLKIQLTISIRGQLETYEKRVTFSSVTIDDSLIDSNNISVVLEYIIKSISGEIRTTKDKISIKIQKVR